MKKIALLFTIFLSCTTIYAQKKDDATGNAGNAARTNADTKYTEGASGVKRSISYKFSTSLSNEDPGNGVFRYNADAISKVSYIYLDNNDLLGDDQTKWYRTWDDTTGATARGQLNIVEKDGKNINVFYITGVFSAEEGFWKIPVEYVSGALPADGSVYFYVFNRIARKDKDQAAQQKKEEQVKPEEIVAVAEVIKEEVKPVIEQVVVEQKKEEVVKPVEKVEEVISEKKEEVKPVVEQVVVEQKKEEVIKPVEKVEEVIPEKKEEVKPVVEQIVVEQKKEEVVKPVEKVEEVIPEKKEEVKPVVEQVVVEQKKEEVIKPVEKVEEVIPEKKEEVKPVVEQVVIEQKKEEVIKPVEKVEEVIPEKKEEVKPVVEQVVVEQKKEEVIKPVEKVEEVIPEKKEEVKPVIDKVIPEQKKEEQQQKIERPVRNKPQLDEVTQRRERTDQPVIETAANQQTVVQSSSTSVKTQEDQVRKNYDKYNQIFNPSPDQNKQETPASNQNAGQVKQQNTQNNVNQNTQNTINNTQNTVNQNTQNTINNTQNTVIYNTQNNVNQNTQKTVYQNTQNQNSQNTNTNVSQNTRVNSNYKKYEEIFNGSSSAGTDKQVTQAETHVTPTDNVTHQEVTSAQPTGSTLGSYGYHTVVTEESSSAYYSSSHKWWHGIIEAGYGFGMGEYGMNNLRVNFINAIGIGKCSTIGLGLGFRNYLGYGNPVWYSVSGDMQLPLFVDLRTSFSKRRVTPYIAVGAGTSLRLGGTEIVSEGLYVCPSGGIWFNVSEKFAFFLGAAYELQKLEFANYADDIPYKKNAGSLSINLGISF